MKKLEKIIYVLILIILSYIGICSIIQQFTCPKMTRTELLLEVKENIKFNFKHCKKSNY